MNTIDRNIDLNLRLIYSHKRHERFAHELENINGDHMSRYEAISMADYLVTEGLIDRDNERCTITKFGLQVMEQFGGWKEYQEYIEEEERKKQNFYVLKEELEYKNLQLQNENLEYQKKNRLLKEEIDILQKQNLKLSGKRHRLNLLIAAGGALLGFLGALFF